ncbi:energy transducer TonB [Daejeonella lutea]|uniref:TonB family C-terminal domain-containing protein n=1 Tax=Daejeonella lutea TaxID=572036 RepID=A0A1T5DNK3_9SPHI|nr:energy transducer TonB [Daejeonella lutea]SKB73043.1 TonB family C-terminal domain-containing protein [Daejeonella lutea]
MIEEPADSQQEITDGEIKKDKSLLYMGIGLGVIILVMGYLTLFVDNLNGLFSKKQEVVTVIDDDNSNALDENASMTDAEVRTSLIKFIEAFYNDQRRGYFDPPSYFAPITQTYYNYHNLTYKRLKDLHYKRSSEMQNLKLQWIVSSLDYDRSGADLIATYWARVNYVKPAVNKEESADVKYEMVINEEGKISSLREVEIKNLVAYDLGGWQDSMAGEETGWEAQSPVEPAEKPAVSPGSAPAETPNPDSRYEGKLYDLGSVETAPEFQGGSKALARFLGSALRYPAKAREAKTQGKVYIGFVVEKNGSLTDFKVIKGIGNGCDEEAVRVLKLSPAWKPGTAEGKPVRTSYVQPITYQISE